MSTDQSLARTFHRWIDFFHRGFFQIISFTWCLMLLEAVLWWKKERRPLICVCREWRSWRLPVRTWRWEGNTPPWVLMPPTMPNLRLMGKYPPSQRRRRISNRPAARPPDPPADRPTKLPANLHGKPNKYSKQQQRQHHPPLQQNRRWKNDSECYFLFCKKKRKKKRKSYHMIM